MRRKSGYIPWVARNAPTFNKTLNTTYIKLSVLVPIVFTSVFIGAITAFAAHNTLDSYLVSMASKLPWSQHAEKTIQKEEETRKPITIVKPETLPFIDTENTQATPPIETKVATSKNEIVVPPIPMTTLKNKK